jgi:vancomycin resistance protein YoaR
LNGRLKTVQTNIKLATCAINGVILLPGEVFSFNEVVGPRGPEYGFVEAPELVNFELVPGYGGGICQVASTLFHAALLAGLDVVEHHNHSRPSTYISMGLDATVAYDYLDLKLGNNGVSPVLFVAGIGEDRLEVAIVGKKWTPETIRLEIGEIEEIPPPVEQVVDPTLLPGEILEEEKGLSGYKVKVERINMFIRSRTISRSHQ